MKKRLPKSFTLLLFFFLLSNYLSATPECPIVTGSFQLPNGTTSDPSATGWYLDASHVASTGYFAVKSNRIMAQTLGGEAIWYSRVFSTAGYSGFQAAIKITAEGQEDNTEYVKIYYKIDGGPLTLLDQRTGNWGTIDFTSAALNGNNIQLVVKLYNYSHGSQASKYYIEQYRVFKEKGPCAVSSGITVTGNGGVLTCSNPSIALAATATGSGTTIWSWSGPNGFTSTTQNPTVSTAGTYNVTATNSSGTGSTSVTVTEDKTPPTVTATGGTLTCGSSGVTLSAASSVSGSTFRWAGPNSFTSSTQNPTVTAAGTYTVTVTNPNNGCSASQSVTVTTGGAAASTIWLEDFTGLANGTTSDNGATAWTSSTSGTGTYSVQNGEFKTSFSGQSEGVWTSQAIDISSKTNVTFSVDLRSETASGSDQFETLDYVRVYYVLNGGTPVLAYEDLAGIGNSTSGTSSYTFSSASLNGSTLQIIIKTNDSDPTERYYFDNIKVSGVSSNASLNITQTGLVTCTSSAQLQATASSTVSAWSWTGPNNFTSTAQNPVVNAGGQYTVTATLTSGCTVSGVISVTENKTAPDIKASATPIELNCIATSATLTGSSATSGVTYSWSSAGSVIASTPQTSVNIPGTYTLTVTNPANSCTASSQVVVTQNITPPTGISAANSGTVTCSNANVTITGTVSNTGLTYSWTGPNGFTSSALSATVTRGGTYVLTATDPANGCSASASTVVGENTAAPGDFTITNSGTITCYNTSLTVVARSSVSGLNYAWTGPNGFAASTASITVTHGGPYNLTVTNPANGCSASKPTTVAENTVRPVVTITNTSPLSCTNPTVTLSATTTTANAGFLWVGPDDFADVNATTVVSEAGTYLLTVNNQANGCDTTLSVDVTGDPNNCGARKATDIAAKNATTAVSSFTYSAYPNPVTMNGVIQFTSPVSTTVSVSIYNMLGACEKVLFKGTATANQQYRAAVPVDQLHAGAYYYIINTNGKVYTGKLVIVK